MHYSNIVNPLGSAQGMGAVYARKFAELGNVCHCVDVATEMNEKMVSPNS